MLFRYAQLEEKGKWIEVLETPDIDKKLKEMGAVRATVLAVSEAIRDDTDKDNIKYKGPLYFDIDSADLEQAIVSTQELVQKLRELEVPEEAIKVYCSGKKGFHVFVPEKVFSDNKRAVKSLPAIYMELAKDLYVHGMDFQVYSGNKGRMFRPENGRRDDGAYRVRITLAELTNMTPALYKQVVQAPRQLPFPEVNGAKSHMLAALYERAKATAHKKATLRDTALPVEELKPYAEDPPACIPALIQSSGDVHFNQAGLQLAAFIARAGVPRYKATALMDELASKKESTTYHSFNRRKIHLEGLVKYTQNKQSVQFSCAAMRSLVGKKCCLDCPLKAKTLGGRGMNDMPAVLARPDGYFIAGQNEDRRISTFTLHPLEVYVEQGQGGRTPRRTHTSMQIQAGGDILGTIVFDETGWRSKAELLKQMEGIGNLGFLGSDADVQKIKIACYSTGEDEVEEITKVHSVGIFESATNVSGQKIYTYVEPGLSVNSYGIQGTHEFHGRSSPEPTIRATARPEPGDPVILKTLQDLLRINSPLVIAQLVGWHSLCHIKTQVMSLYGQFPSLNLWGNAGSGKTMTSSLMACLNGVDYGSTGNPLLLSSTTAWPVIEAASSTTTIPRIFEEFNRSKIKKHGMYEHCLEIIKAAWNNHPVSRGRVRSSRASGSSLTNAEVVEVHITAPLVICSEQAPEEPALQQRMIQVELSNKTRQGCDQHFYEAISHRQQVLSFARALTMTALKTKEDWVAERLQAGYERVPSEVNDRSRLAYGLLFVGLDYLEGVGHSLNFDLTEDITELKHELEAHLDTSRQEISQAKVWSEVDNVLRMVADMAQLGIQDSGLSPLIPGRHFLLIPERDELILDMQVIFPLLQRWMKQTGNDSVFQSMSQLVPLMKSEDYWLTSRRMEPAMSKNRMLWVFRASKMEEKGHNTGMFSE